MYIANISYAVDRARLSDFLEQTFPRIITRVNLVTDHATGRSRGFAFAEVDSATALDVVPRLKGLEFEGCRLAIQIAGGSRSRAVGV